MRRQRPVAGGCVTLGIGAGLRFACRLFWLFSAMSLMVSNAPPNASAQDATRPESLWQLEEVVTTGRIAGLHLSETNHRRSSDLFTLTNAEITVKLEVYSNLESNSAEVLIKQSVMGVHALYADALSPYPGDISNRIVTDRRFMPVYREKTKGGLFYRYFLVYANERFTYGATTRDAAHFRSLLGWIYCGQKARLYRIRCFAPASTSDETLERWFLRLTCP